MPYWVEFEILYLNLIKIRCSSAKRALSLFFSKLNTFVMGDKWKGKALTIAGRAAAVVEVSIKRTIIVDADFYERFSSILNDTNADYPPSGLTQVDEFYRLV